MIYEIAHWILVPPGQAVLAGRRSKASTPCRSPAGCSSPATTSRSPTASVIPILAPRKVVFLAKKDYFDGQAASRAGWSGAWFEAIDMVPVDRDDTRAAIDSTRHRARGARPGRGVRHLPRGHPLPRRAALPRPRRCRPPGAHRRRARRTRRRAGHPGHPAPRHEVAAPRQGVGQVRQAARLHRTVRRGAAAGRARREVTDEIMAAIQELSGQELAGRYNEHPSTP